MPKQIVTPKIRGMSSLDRVIKIANFVMKQFIGRNEQNLSEQGLTMALVRLGYEPDEIEAAFKLLYSIPVTLRADAKESIHFQVHGYRILSPAEMHKISVPCQGEILRLVTSGLITAEEMEEILGEALKVETTEVGLKELDLILHKVIDDEERLLMILVNPGDHVPCFILN